MAAEDASKRVYASADDVHAYVRRICMAEGVPEADAKVVADCLLMADLRGVDTHGVARLGGYLGRVRKGLITAAPKLQPKRVTPVAATLDGQNGFGFVTSTRAMAEAIDIASEFGIGICSVHSSTHFGMAACYVLQAIEAGYISLVFTNASPAMPPWGGRTGLLGTSPIAAGAPGGKDIPYVLDMSPAVAARGKIRRAERRGETIPEGYALDAQGKSTTDPTAALGGVVLPMGGPKGSGIAMLMDIFGGVISGAGFAGGVLDQYKVFDKPQNVGHFFLALKPDLFVSSDDYAQRMDTLVANVHGAPKADGFKEIMMPGEPEAREEAKRRRQGIPYSPVDIEELRKEAEKSGVEPLKASDTPLAA